MSPFNSPVETGVRSLAILLASFPKSFDLQRLVVMDYLVVHSGDAEGPNSLHAPLPLRVGELVVRRELVEKGLKLMMSKGLIVFVTDSSGVSYKSTDTAAPFMETLTEKYNLDLIDRAEWVVSRFGRMTIEQVSQYMRKISSDLEHQFQALNSTESVF